MLLGYEQVLVFACYLFPDELVILNVGTAPTGRRECYDSSAIKPRTNRFWYGLECKAHIGYFVPLIKIADFLRAGVEVSSFSCLPFFATPF